MKKTDFADEDFPHDCCEYEDACSDNPESLKIISKLHKLAIDPRNRQLMGEDMVCIETTISYLDNQSDEVVYKALEILSYLATYSDKNSIMLAKNQLFVSKLQQANRSALKFVLSKRSLMYALID